jgi:hypothetical protein
MICSSRPPLALFATQIEWYSKVSWRQNSLHCLSSGNRNSCVGSAVKFFKVVDRFLCSSTYHTYHRCGVCGDCIGPEEDRRNCSSTAASLGCHRMGPLLNIKSSMEESAPCCRITPTFSQLHIGPRQYHRLGWPCTSRIESRGECRH